MLQIRVSTTQTKQGSKSTEQTTSVMTIISTQTNAQQTVQWEHTVQLGLQADCDFCDEPIEHSWLPLVSILKGSVGLPTAWSMDSFKGSSLIWNNSYGLCRDMPLWSLLCCARYPLPLLQLSCGFSSVLWDIPWRQAGSVCLHPVWNFWAIIWFPFPNSSHIFLPSPLALSVLRFCCCCCCCCC